MAAKHVLLIEDQHDIAANIWDFLERRGYVVDHAADGATGLMHASRGRFDVIVLDLGLPRLDGIELCRRLRAAGNNTPVLMLTARDTLEDKLLGYAEGADDYVVKPFHLKELEARIRVLSRERMTDSTELVVGPLRLNVPAMMAYREGKRVLLTRTQAAVLAMLIQRSPGVVTHIELADYLWEGRDHGIAALHNHVYALRALVDKPFKYKMVQSVHGIGYRVIAPHD